MDNETTNLRKPMRKYSVLIVHTGHDSVDETKEMVSRSGDFRAEHARIESVRANPLAYSPDIVVLDLASPSTDELEVLVEIRGNYGDVPVIIVSEALDDAQMRKLLKLKIHDWHRKPLVQADFHSSLSTSIRNAKAQTTRVHAVISAMGGAGGTTVAISIADALAQRLAKQKASVGLFDLDFSSGSCGMMLNLQASLNLDSVITHPERIDHEFVGLMQQKHAHGFLLYSFKRRDFVTHLNGYEVVLRLLDAVTLEHAHTVLDIPYYEVDWAQDVLSAVNTVTVVCELNIPSIKHALDTLKSIKALQGGPKQVNVLVNKCESGLFKRARIPEAKLKELFGDTPFRMLPRDDATFAEALDRGVVPSDVKGRNKFSKEIDRYIADVIVNEKAAAK